MNSVRPRRMGVHNEPYAAPPCCHYRDRLDTMHVEVPWYTAPIIRMWSLANKGKLYIEEPIDEAFSPPKNSHCLHPHIFIGPSCHASTPYISTDSTNNLIKLESFWNFPHCDLHSSSQSVHSIFAPAYALSSITLTLYKGVQYANSQGFVHVTLLLNALCVEWLHVQSCSFKSKMSYKCPDKTLQRVR